MIETANRPFRHYNSWVKLNLGSLAIGVLIALLVTVTIGLVSGWPSREQLLVSLMFGLIIGFCIANSIYVINLFGKRKRGHGIWFLLAYYGLTLMGMAIGVELTYVLVSLLFGTPYRFFHLEDLKINAFVVVVLTTVIYGYFSMKERQKTALQQKEMDLMRMGKLKTEAELAALQSKINPHFLYNALNSVASLIPSDPARAEAMVLKLSALFRQHINQEQGHWATVADEVGLVETYLDIERVRFGDRIRFSVTVAPDVESVTIPRFLLQPLAENALKHGLKDVTTNGVLDIAVEQRGGRLWVTVADNGQPFPDELHVGYGLQSTYDKLQLLYGDDYRLAMVNTPRKQLQIDIPIQT